MNIVDVIFLAVYIIGVLLYAMVGIILEKNHDKISNIVFRAFFWPLFAGIYLVYLPILLGENIKEKRNENSK